MEWGLSELKPTFFAYLATSVLALLLGGWVSGRLASPWRSIARGAVVFLALRLLLLGNPWAWSFYAENLRPRHVGWRQMSVIREELRSWLRPPEGIRYLAVGSSQTDALYERLSEERPDLEVFGMAGLFPLDFVLYRDRIAEFRPEVVLLYLSEFDLARIHEAERVVLAPPQGARLPALALTLARGPGGERYRRPLVEMAFGQVLPEYRFGFVFRGLVRKAEGRDRFEARAAPGDGPAEPLPPDALAREIADLRGSMTEDQIDFNLPFLRSFVETCGRWGSRVVIVEGQYSPAVSTDATRRLNERVVRELHALAERYDHVTFVPRGRQPSFGDEDWVDATHVSREAGKEFAAELLRRLED